MHRRPLGAGRRLALIGAIVVVIGSVLPWYTLGGEAGQLTAIRMTAFDGAGILTFLAALATMALVALPYAAGERPLAVDRGLAFGILAIVGIVGLILFIPASDALVAPAGMLPDRAYGYWITLVGTITLGRAAYNISLEPPHR